MNTNVQEFTPSTSGGQSDANQSNRGRSRRGGQGGRGRDGLPANTTPQNEDRDTQRGRGNRGRDQGRGRGDRRDDNNQESRGRGRGNRQMKDYFDDKRRQKKDEDRETADLLNKKEVTFENAHAFNDEGQAAAGKKRGNREGKKTYTNLGSAGKFLGNDNSERAIRANEKMKFVTKGERNMKDKAKVKYNYKDFLNQYQNLSEQCTFLVEQLSDGKQECLICQNAIYQRSAIWNCQQCCQPLHLGCIKRWISKLNKSLEQNIQDMEEEEKREAGIVEMQDSEEEEKFDPAEVRDPNKKQWLAFYNWTCPNCNYAYAQNNLPRYSCYCGRFEEPDYDPLVLPHSCGEYCNRPKNKDCTHGDCNILCHPGACPPCNISVSVKCYCSQSAKYVPCNIASRSAFQCDKICGKELNCSKHFCEQECHQGPCQPCQIAKDIDCFCGKETRDMLCGESQFTCENTCGSILNCGQHKCEKICHSGKCLDCQKDPSKVLFCPSGHRTIESLIGKQRQTCTEPIPVCDQLCERFLACGKHQCTNVCHIGDCMRCEEMVDKACICGKTKIKIECYKVNYPLAKQKKFMTQEEIDDINNYRCKKVCNQSKRCKRHLCKEICCPVKSGFDATADPRGLHLCTITCNKMLSCGTHQCGNFCHIGYCKPCQWVSNQPIFCPCGIAKLDPPIKCGIQPPSCKGPCLKKLDCGHQCSMRCHNGNCPPCLEKVTRFCQCGKEVFMNAFCRDKHYNCGKKCDTSLLCGHKCIKKCHLPGKCVSNIDDLMEKGCGERCGKERKRCEHKCIQKCHPNKDCPDTPCEAELRVYCKCGAKWVEVICKSNPDRPPIECDTRCWKKQRDSRIASAFGTSADFQANKDTVKFEYYPEEALEFACENLAWAKKLENTLTYIVMNKSTKSYTYLTPEKRRFLDLMVHEHFKLDMCVYGGHGQKRVTDIFWKDGCLVPELLCSEVAEMINKGIQEVKMESQVTTIFEATLSIFNVSKGNSIDTLKKFMSGFKNEMYTEKGTNFSQFKIHFYKWQTAKMAYNFIQSVPNQFSNCQLIHHRKEIGTGGEDLASLAAAAAANKKKPKYVAAQDGDDDDFLVVQR